MRGYRVKLWNFLAAHCHRVKLWNFETLKLWNSETLKLWNFETLKLWNFETLKLWNFETLCSFAFYRLKFNFKEFMNLTKNIQAAVVPTVFPKYLPAQDALRFGATFWWIFCQEACVKAWVFFVKFINSLKFNFSLKKAKVSKFQSFRVSEFQSF